jgi:Mg-chelatase subunit ChlD
MSLLTPLYLLGLAAVALPVVFHLIRRQPRGRRVFSTVMFLEPSPPTVTRRSRLDQWPLLLLRAAALCLLALAFARPLVRELLGTDENQAPGESIVVLVDTSASMRRQGLWEQVVQRVEIVVAKCRDTDRVAILAFDREVRPLVTFEEWAAVDEAARRPLVGQRMAGASPGWSATHLDQALTVAKELLRSREASTQDSRAGGSKRIVLISDFAEGNRVQGLAGIEWPQDVIVTAERVVPHSSTNAGVQLVAAIEDGDRIREPRTELHSVRQARGENGARGSAASIRVRITNAADSTVERFQLEWRKDGAAGEAHVSPVEVYCPPGQSRVVPVAMPEALKLPARLVLRGDDHEFDNTVVVDQPTSEPVHALLYSDELEDDPAGLRFYLEWAFAAAGPQPVIVTSQPPDAPGPVPLPRDVPLVIVADAPAEDCLPGLRRYVEQGGTLLIVAAGAETCAVWERLLDGARLQAVEADVTGYAMLSGIDFSHPLFAPFNEPRFADFTNVRVWKHRELKLDAAAGLPRVVARFDSGSPAIIEQPLGRGRVLLFAFGWHPADSQLARSTKFVPMLHALVGVAAGQDEGPRRLVVGDALPLTARMMESAAELVVRTPDDRRVQLAAGEGPFRGTVVPGVYHVATDSDRERRFAVSLPPEESRTAPLPPEQVESLGVRLGTSETTIEAADRAARERQLRTEELESRQKHWRWLVLAALAVLILETWLAGSLARSGQG